VTTAPNIAEWHVRWSRPDAKTALFGFIDANADRIMFPELLEKIEKDDAFRELFISTIANAELRSFGLETPRITQKQDVEIALTEAPLAKKFKINPEKYAAHFKPDEIVSVFAEGETTLVVPVPKQVEGWYADLPTFLNRIHRIQVGALFQAVARVARAELAKAPIWITSSAPGAAWLSFSIWKTPPPQGFLYKRYGR
jgi:hypothetical protein